MDWPIVTVVLITYDRPEEIRRTIYALLTHINYPRDRLRWHLADDHSPDGYLDKVKEEFRYLCFTSTITDRKGWGANVNKALTFAFGQSDFVFKIEDDYCAKRPINLHSGVLLIDSKDDRYRPEQASEREEIGLVRYDGIAAHWLKLDLREAQTEGGGIHYMRILPSSSHLNCYSHRPHLVHRRFHDYYGMYAEGVRLGVCETNFAHKVRSKMSKGPWLCILEDGVSSAFDHIGKSRQHSDLDVGK